MLALVDLIFIADCCCCDCCRYVAQQRYTDAIDLLKDGAMSLLRANQIASGADLGLLLINTLDKATAPITEKNIGIISNLLQENTKHLYKFIIVKKQNL